MSQRPDPPPWGALITSALRRGGMSARQAARRAGISEGRWRQISGGYQVVRPGEYVSVRGPAGTLARMAAVAGVSPDELREAGREDAAQALEGRGSGTEQVLERIRSLDGDQARELLLQLAVQLGLTGRAELPGSGGRASLIVAGSPGSPTDTCPGGLPDRRGRHRGGIHSPAARGSETPCQLFRKPRTSLSL